MGTDDDIVKRSVRPVHVLDTIPETVSPVELLAALKKTREELIAEMGVKTHTALQQQYIEIDRRHDSAMAEFRKAIDQTLSRQDAAMMQVLGIIQFSVAQSIEANNAQIAALRQDVDKIDMVTRDLQTDGQQMASDLLQVTEGLETLKVESHTDIQKIERATADLDERFTFIEDWVRVRRNIENVVLNIVQVIIRAPAWAKLVALTTVLGGVSIWQDDTIKRLIELLF